MFPQSVHFVESRLLHFDCKLFPFLVGLTCIIFIAAYLAGNWLFPANIREDILEIRIKLETWKSVAFLTHVRLSCCILLCNLIPEWL